MVKKKILIIGHFPPPYDGTSIALNMLRGSENINKYFKVVHINMSRVTFAKVEDIGKMKWDKATQDIFHILDFLRISFNDNPNIVYISIAQTKWGYLRDSVFIIFSKIFRKKCIVHIHGGAFKIFFKNSSLLLQEIIKFTITKVDKVIVLADSLRYMVEDLIEKGKIIAITNCVPRDTMPEEEDVKRKLDRIKRQFKSEPIKVLYLSNLTKTKGYFDLLKAAKILLGKGFNDFELNLAGAFPNQQEEFATFEFIKKEGLEKKVTFHGVVRGKKKKDLFFENDIFALPTYHPPEGQPIAIIEAMAYGLPVITTNYRAIPSLVINKKNGFFVHPKSPDEIAKVIINFAKDPNLIYKIGNENFKKVHKDFTEEIYIENFIKLFKETSK